MTARSRRRRTRASTSDSEQVARRTHTLGAHRETAEPPRSASARGRASSRLGGVNSGRVERGSGELSAGAAGGVDDASGVADSGGADQAADDAEPAGDADAEPERVERGCV